MVGTGTEIADLEMFTEYSHLQLGSKKRPGVMILMKEKPIVLCSSWPASRSIGKYCCGWPLRMKAREATIIIQGNSQGSCSGVQELGDPQGGPSETELHNFSYSSKHSVLFYLDSISGMFKQEIIFT